MSLKLCPQTLGRTVLLAVAAVTLPVAAPADDSQAPQKGKEKCYGVAKAGENGCQALNGSHTCGGGSREDFRGEDWKWVPAGTCLTLGGQQQPFDGFGKWAAAPPTAKTTSSKTTNPKNPQP